MKKIPEEFLTLGRWFHQDCDYGCETLEQVIENAIASAGLSREQRERVRAYLDELLSGKYSNGDLSSIWRKTRAELRFGSVRGKARRNFCIQCDPCSTPSTTDPPADLAPSDSSSDFLGQP